MNNRFTSEQKRKALKTIEWVVLIFVCVVYVYSLIHLTLFRFVSLRDLLSHEPVPRNFTHGLNLVPFSDWNVNRPYMIQDIILNTLLFFPFGFLLQMVFGGKKPHWSALLVPAVVSVGIETAQYCFVLGAADVTDVISNTFGAWLGCLCYLLWQRIFWKNFEKAKRVLLCCLGVVALLVLCLNI